MMTFPTVSGKSYVRHVPVTTNQQLSLFLENTSLGFSNLPGKDPETPTEGCEGAPKVQPFSTVKRLKWA